MRRALEGDPVRAIEIRGAFGLANLALVERPDPRPGPGQARSACAPPRSIIGSADVEGKYNPKQKLP